MENNAVETTDNLDITDGFKVYMSQIVQIPLLTDEEQRKLAAKANQGDEEAVKQLAKSNTLLVVSIAKSIVQKREDMMDVISAGNEGLMRAIKGYNSELGFKFSTYATWWIRSSIIRCLIEKNQTIRLPNNIYEEYNSAKKAREALTNELGREPSISEWAQRLNISKEKLEKLIDYNTIKTESLDKTMGEEETSFSDFVGNDNAIDPQAEIERKDIAERLYECIELLSEREQFVIVHRFGLYGNEPKTLATIGEKLNITKAGVRKIEQTALKKLKSPVEKKVISD